MGSGPPQLLRYAASSPYTLRLPGCHVPARQHSAHCSPGNTLGWPSPASSWFHQVCTPVSPVLCSPEDPQPPQPPLPLSACALACQHPFPGLDQFVSDIIFTASVLGLKGHFHFNGGTVCPRAALGSGAPQRVPVWEGNSLDQKGCFTAHTHSSGVRP